MSAAAVVVCALSLLGRSEQAVSPITLVDVAPPNTSVGTEAFILRGVNAIHLVTSAVVFRQALIDTRQWCRSSPAVKKLASIIAHEEWHMRNGPDERGAYLAQLTTLNALGAGPGTPLYHTVVKSMQVVLGARKRQESAGIGMLASR